MKTLSTAVAAEPAGLVNAFLRESVALFHCARRGKTKKADARCRWFLPLLRMDTVLKFVQLIKLVQQEAGWSYATSASARRGSRWWAPSARPRWPNVRESDIS